MHIFDKVSNEVRSKATVTPDGASPLFFLRVKVK